MEQIKYLNPIWNPFHILGANLNLDQNCIYDFMFIYKGEKDLSGKRKWEWLNERGRILTYNSRTWQWSC